MMISALGFGALGYGSWVWWLAIGAAALASIDIATVMALILVGVERRWLKHS
jgi:hypothetical protein